MKYHFCTLFDKNYLYKGVTLYHSLLEHCGDFMLWVLCMDEETHDVLTKLKLNKVSLIRLNDFEDEELLRIKPTRTMVEYFWTCSPSLPWYLLRKYPSLDMITYLDADLFFYSDPAPIYHELGGDSILIIEHRFPEQFKHLEVNGIYNVQMLVFRNDPHGLECLNWWRDRCNEWCFYRLEDGKMGDQKYLDDWPTRFRGVHVLQHKGAGLALWNITRYQVHERQGTIFVDDDELIFYHFHQFGVLQNGSYDYGDQGIYTLTPENAQLIYVPYTEAVEKTFARIRKVFPKFSHGLRFIRKDSPLDTVRNKMRSARNRIVVLYNRLSKEQ